ncbi:MAG: type II toxin-antitoxin system RelE/ParE family toxin [Rhizobiales bacterium]|nr:type II toxin-antitoxin system RelE/ParE family toxin [Hyphomicrobiales bacterium]
MALREYVDSQGRSPFRGWFERLDEHASAKITLAIVRLEQGNFSNAKSMGSGVFEYRVDYGPGYRIYFGRNRDTLVILLGGGTKKRQQYDIDVAKARWLDYKKRKKR